MIKLFYYVLCSLTLLYGLYFIITAMFAFKKNTKEEIKSNKTNNFAILIAARNEQYVIGNLIDSLKHQNYPSESFEVYTIINNCTDNTLTIAKEHEAKVIVCKDKINSKGDALNYAFKKLKNNKNIDAYLIFDADNIVDPNFLMEMNKAINMGYNVAQGFRESKNLNDNWLSGSYSLYYYLQNFFFNKARNNINLSSSINGTAFMVKKSIIDSKGFNVKTLTEDVEFTAICSLNDEKIAFVENAITYDEQPISFAVSFKQRKRWTKGVLQCLKYYHRPLIKKVIKEKSICALDILLIFFAPIIQIVSFSLTTILILFQMYGIKLDDIFSYYFLLGIFFFLTTYLIGVIINMYIIKYNKHKIKESISGIFLFSFFIYTWVPINFLCLFKKNIVWESVSHTRNVKINELITENK